MKIYKKMERVKKKSFNQSRVLIFNAALKRAYVIMNGRWDFIHFYYNDHHEWTM